MGIRLNAFSSMGSLTTTFHHHVSPPRFGRRFKHLLSGFALLAQLLIGVFSGPQAQAGANHLWTYGSGSWSASGRTGVQLDSTPAVGLDGTLYVMSDDFRLRAITPGATAGTHKWVSSTPTYYPFSGASPQNSPSVASDGTIWIAPANSSGNHIYAINPANGAVLHDESITNQKISIGAPAIGVNDWSYTVFYDCVVAIGRIPGGFSEKWAHAVPVTGDHQVATMAAISNPQIVYGVGTIYTNQTLFGAETRKSGSSFNNRIFALKQTQYSSGSTITNQAWIWNFPGSATELPVGHLTVNADDTVYVIGKNGSTHKLYAVDGGSGSTLWTMTLAFTPSSNPSIGADGFLYVPCSDGVRGINPFTQTVAWTHSVGRPVNTTPLVGIDGRIYFAYDGSASGDASVRCISYSGGTVTTQWTETLSTRKYRNAPPVMDRKGRLFILNSESAFASGQLVALKGAGRPALTGWPMWGRGYSRNSRAGETWRAVNLFTLGGYYSVAEAVNNLGQAAGGAHDSANIYKGVFTATGTAVWTDPLPSINAETPVFGINNTGVLAGRTYQNSAYQAYRYVPGAGQTILGYLPSGSTAAGYAINDGGRIVGYCYNSLGAQRGVFWNSGSTTANDVQSLVSGSPSAPSVAYAVNSSGRIVGASLSSTGYWHAFLTDSTGLISPFTDDLQTLGGDTSFGYGVNDAGDVAGNSQNSGGSTRLFYKPFGQTMQDLGMLAGASSGTAQDVNNNGLVVGDCYLSSGGYRAVVGVGGLSGLVNLNDAVTAGPFNVLSVANAANDADWIVGYGLDNAQNYRAFVLRPNE